MAGQKLKAGAARIEIRNPENFFPYSSFRGRYFTGQHDPLYVRSIMLEQEGEKSLMLSLELGDFGDIPEWQEKIMQVCDIAQDHIFITVTHNHPAPHVSDDWKMEVDDVEKTAQYTESVWEAMREAVTAAEAALQPATVAYGTGSCDININRDFFFGKYWEIGKNPHGDSDKTVVVARFAAEDGTPIAFYINYAVHSSVMMGCKIKDGGMYVSGDLAGYTSWFVENYFGGDTVALWTSGAAGNQDPKYTGCRHVLDREGEMKEVDLGESAYALVEVQGEELGIEVVNIAKAMGEGKSDVTVQCMQKDYLTPGKAHPGTPPFMWTLDDPYVDADPFYMHMGLIAIDDVAVVGIPGEPDACLGRMVREALADRFKQVVICTHCNGSISYMTDEAGFEKHLRSAVVTHVRRGYAEKILVDGALDMAGSLQH